MLGLWWSNRVFSHVVFHTEIILSSLCNTHAAKIILSVFAGLSRIRTQNNLHAESILNNSACPWQSVVVHFLALVVPGWNSWVRSEQIYRFRVNASSPTITKSRGSSLVGGSLKLGILSASASRDFPKIDLLKVHHLICRIHQHQLFTYLFHPLLPSGVEGIPESRPILSILYCQHQLWYT
jgi:hypothetical protein